MAFSSNQQAVADLYISILGRAADKAGLDYWVSRVEGTNTDGEAQLTISEVSDLFFDPSISQEVADMFPNTLTNTELVETVYSNTLSRDPDAGGLAYWVSRLDGTNTDGEPQLNSAAELTDAILANLGAGDDTLIANRKAFAEFAYYNNLGGDLSIDSISYDAESLSNAQDTAAAANGVENPVDPATDTTAPTLSSTAVDAKEEATEIAAGTTITTITADEDVTYTLSGTDAALFAIDADGVVTNVDALTPDYETQTSYSFTVTATDGIYTTTEDISFDVTNIAETLTISDADTTDVVVNTAAINNLNALTNAATAATVTTDADNMNGATITIDVSNGYLVNDDYANATVVAPLNFNGTNFSFAGTSIIADSSVVTGDSDAVIGSYALAGTTDIDADTADGEVIYGVNQITITIDSELVTADTINQMLADIRIPDVVSAADRSANTDAESHGNVTVTVADTAGNSDTFTVLHDTSAAIAFANGADNDAEVQVADAENHVLDADIEINLNGAETDGMVITVSSDTTTDGLHLNNETGAIAGANTARAVGENLVYTADGATETIIGTIAGVDTNSLTITFNSDATDAAIDDVLQQIETDLDSSVLGAHTFTTSVTSGDSLESLTGEDASTKTVTIVGDFTNNSGSAVELATVLAGTTTTPYEITGNTYINLGTDDYSAGATDVQQLIDDGKLVVTGTPVIRFVTDGAADITPIENLSALGDYSFGDANAQMGHQVTMTAAQADGKSGDSTAALIVNEVENTLAVDLSGLTTSGTYDANIALTEDAEFTGNLGSFNLDATGAFTLTVAASVADGKDIDHEAAQDIVVTGLDATFEGDLGELDTAQANAGVVVEVTDDLTLHADAQIDSDDLEMTVANNKTLTLSTAQATAVNTANGAITGTDAIGDGNTGGSIALSLVDEDTNTDGVQVSAIDLSALTAGGIATGATSATAGSLTLEFASDTTLDGVLTQGTATVTVASGATLTAASNNNTLLDLDGATISGEGNVALTELELDANADISGITVSGTKTADFAADTTFTGDLGTFDVTVAADATLTTTAAKLDGLTVTGEEAAAKETGGSVAVSIVDSDDVDLSNITAGAAGAGTVGALNAAIDASGATVTLDTATDLGSFDISIDGANNVTVTEAQATGRTFTDVGDDATKLVIEGLTSTTDISGINFDGSATDAVTINAYTGAITLDSAADLTVTAANTTTIALKDTELTATARQLDLIAITGADDTTTGSDDDTDNDTVVTISGNIAADSSNDTIDLTAIASSANLTFGAGIEVGTGVELILNDSAANGATLTGAGTVTVEDITASSDLSNITATTFDVEMTADANLTASTTLGSIDSFDIDDSVTVTVTAAQAETNFGAITNDGTGGGTLAVTNGSDDYNLDLSTIITDANVSVSANMGSGDDTVQGGAGNDTLTGGLGSDTYVFDAAATNGSDTVVGFTIADYDTISLDTAGVTSTGFSFAAAAAHDFGALGLIVTDGDVATADGSGMTTGEVATALLGGDFTNVDADEVAYAAFSSDHDNAANVEIYEVVANGTGDGITSVTLVATINGVVAADMDASVFNGFA